MNANFLFFSAEAKSPAGKYLMDLISPIEVEFNEKFSNKYSVDKLNNITIVFICTDEEMLSQGFFKERHYISWKQKYADIRLMIPYVSFVHANPEIKKKMMWDVILRALDYLRERNALLSIEEFTKDLQTIYWSK